MEEDIPQDELLRLAGLRYAAKNGNEEAGSSLKESLIERKALVLLREVGKELDWPKDSTLEARLESEIAKEREELEAKVKDAEENFGESEVREALLTQSKFVARTGSLSEAVEAYDKTLEKTVGSGQKIDVVLALIRLGFAANDFDFTRKNIARAKELIEKGGDWERKNRLRVYEGVFNLARRDMAGGAKLLLESLATFSATELCSYRDFILYTVITALVSVDRPTLKGSVANAPEILTMIHEIGRLEEFLQSVVACEYKTFMSALPDIIALLKTDRYLGVHSSYIGRELRVVIYTQFLQSYQSVRIESMANIFGVTVDFLDEELCRFITAGRINCKIDRVRLGLATASLDLCLGAYIACMLFPCLGWRNNPDDSPGCKERSVPEYNQARGCTLEQSPEALPCHLRLG
mmetsp:Transcript_38716/g.152885  ORF Transcript_38716/g.152885 Transcript_38716/m.152885 type:complete len:408 (-) Transcript_38716:260-1483(-)